MALNAGARLGPYEIVSPLGAGGMGEVYKARDRRLDRTVAIKILPHEFASDADLRARFEREARAIAALDHPHICAIYDVGEAVVLAPGTEPPAPVQYLVMQHLEGETLAERLARTKGPLPIDQALTIAIEIAAALDKAHRVGITHRDLKPANIMLTKTGAKLLDFGLAKLRGPAAPISMSGMTRLATTAPGTAHGTILGTVHYMAPEQVEGHEADARSDIWALGVVLYEMLTGTRPFEGTSAANVIGSILKDTPQSLTARQPLAPAAVDHVVARCIEKDRDERWQSATDIMHELKWIRTRSGEAATVPSHDRRSVRRAWATAAVAAVAALAFAAPASMYLRSAPAARLPTRFDIAIPPTKDAPSIALSHDGRQLAFVATAEGASRLFVRALDQVAPKLLPGTEDASDPFWAPDGKAIGFFADGKLKRVDLTGASPLVLADAPSERGGTWSIDGSIVFAPTTSAGLFRVPASGGTPTAVTQLAPGHANHRWPQALPDGRRILFFVASGHVETRGTYLTSLDGGAATRVMKADSAAEFAAPGSLLLVQQGVLLAAPFDPARGRVLGDSVPIAQGIGFDFGSARGTFAVSDAGVLAYSSSVEGPRQLVWVDRTGNVRGTLGPSESNGLANPELAPDGRRVAVNRNVLGNADIWLIDVGRGVPTRFTSDAGIDNSPLWSPDGRRIVFRSNRNGAYDLYEKPADGAREERVLVATPEDKNPVSWSSDGRFLLYATQHAATGGDLWAVPLTGDGKPFPVVQTPFDETAGQFSPDARWIAFESNASNQRVEVYVQPFPGPGATVQVSTAGGSQPRWRPDGKELFYIAPDGHLMTAAVTAGADGRTFEAGQPIALFPTELASGRNIRIGYVLRKPQYAVGRDGRFLMNVGITATTAPITVVLDWDAGPRTR